LGNSPPAVAGKRGPDPDKDEDDDEEEDELDLDATLEEEEEAIRRASGNATILFCNRQCGTRTHWKWIESLCGFECQEF